MLVFKERRVAVLLLAFFLFVMLVWSPWRAVDSKVEKAWGWPAQYVRGLRFGVDLIGGSRIVLELEASQVRLGFDRTPTNEEIDALIDRLVENLNTNVMRLMSYDDIAASKEMVVEIYKLVTKDMISPLLNENIHIIGSIEKKVSDYTSDEVIRLLRARVDPYGTLGPDLRSLGANLVLFEVAGLDPERAKALLGRQGRLEIFIENELVLSGGDIERVDAPWVEQLRKMHKYHLPFRLTADGAQKFRDNARGKANYPGVIYLDRPADAVLVFDSAILGELTQLTYNTTERMFYVPDEYGYCLRVSAVGTARDNLSSQASQFLENQENQKLSVRLLGDVGYFSPSVTQNISEFYSKVEYFPRLSGEGADEWVMRACGWESAPAISEELAAGTGEGRNLEITGFRSTSESATEEARDLQTVLSQRLPVDISYESETSIEARLGAEFLKEALIAGVVALLGVWVLVYLRYRHWLIGLAIIGTMICELVITLGWASVLGWTIGLPELGALIIVIGTGIDHQIIITDEVLRGGLPGAKVVSLSGRVSKAFAVIFVAVATTVAAMVMLAWLGFGAMRGFALITLTGVLIAVLVTRPAYARIISAIVLRSAQKP